jgi:phage-related protein
VLTVVFYKTNAGRVPVLEWLRNLSPQDRRDIGLDLLRVQENWPVGMPFCKSLGQGLWEVRSTLQGGRVARLMFCLKDNEVYVVHSFFKTTQKTPQSDLELARKRMKDVMT